MNSSREISPACQGMVSIQNFPSDLSRQTVSLLSSLVSRGSAFFLALRDVPEGLEAVDRPESSSPSFQILLHRLQCQVLRRLYTLSLEQTGQQGIIHHPGTELALCISLVSGSCPRCRFLSLPSALAPARPGLRHTIPVPGPDVSGKPPGCETSVSRLVVPMASGAAHSSDASGCSRGIRNCSDIPDCSVRVYLRYILFICTG